jgi:hypothetical protein
MRNEIKRTQLAKKPRAYSKPKLDGERRLLWTGGEAFGLEYFAIYERHLSGDFHLHMILGFQHDITIERERKKKSKRTDCDLYLEYLAVRFGLGYKTHAVKIKTDQKLDVIKYVTKSTSYLMKDSQHTIKGIPDKGRLIQQSRGFSSQALPESDKEWMQGHRLMIHDLDILWRDINLNIDITEKHLESGFYPPISENDIIESDDSGYDEIF